MASFITRTLIVAGVAALAVAIWQIRLALLLAFVGVLFAILFSGLASRVHGLTGLSRRWALVLVLVALGSLIGGGGYLLGERIAPQFGELSERLLASLEQLPVDLQEIFGNVGSVIFSATKWAATLAEALGYALLAIFVGIYLAAAPDMYRKGLVLLLPRGGEERGEEVLGVMGQALWRWLLGTFVSMVAVGLLTAGGLLVIGVPAALALAIVAALFEFIPLIGPWLAALPAVLLAFADGGWAQTAYVAALYVVVQQLEGNLIYPLVQRRAVALPPAMTALAIVAFGLLFGFLGVFLATPFLIVVLIMINMLYIEDVLGKRPALPAR